MIDRFPFVGIGMCRGCGSEFPKRSGIHMHCRPACREQKPHRAVGPRTYTCMDCGKSGLAGKSGPLPFRCADCKRQWDCRPERLEQKRRRKG